MTIIHVFEFIFIPVQCDKAVRAELLANITLSGGNTKFPGMEKRVYQVSQKTLPTDPLDMCMFMTVATPSRSLRDYCQCEA